MSIQSWSAFYPDILLFVPNCPEFLVDRFLRKAAIDISSKSKRLKFDMDPFDTEAGVATYDLYPDASTETLMILDGSIDGEPLEPVRRDELARRTGWSSESGKPSKYLMGPDDETVRLWPTPDAVFSVSLTLALNPTQTSTGIESWFATRYRDGIISGALASLLALPKQVWSDAGLALFHSNKFQAEIRTACAESDKDGTRAPLRTAIYNRA